MITLVNNTQNIQQVPDLGIELPLDSSLNLTELFDSDKILKSLDLQNQNISGNIIIQINSVVSTYTEMKKYLTYASSIPYDNSNSGLDSTNVQEAIDEVGSSSGASFPSFVVTNTPGIVFTKNGGFVLHRT